MQILFLWDAQSQAEEVMAGQVVRDASEDAAFGQEVLTIAKGAWEHRQATDRWVERVAPQWPTHRQPPVDRNLLRLSVWELTHTTTPAKVVIDEAIELAKHFSTEQSASFINAVMDAILKEHRSLTTMEKQPPEAPKPEDAV
jgi:N utilization substance protein B